MPGGAARPETRPLNKELWLNYVELRRRFPETAAQEWEKALEREATLHEDKRRKLDEDKSVQDFHNSRNTSAVYGPGVKRSSGGMPTRQYTESGDNTVPLGPAPPPWRPSSEARRVLRLGVISGR